MHRWYNYNGKTTMWMSTWNDTLSYELVTEKFDLVKEKFKHPVSWNRAEKDICICINTEEYSETCL